MLAWTQAEKHCGLGPIFQENLDPQSIDLLFQMTHKSLMAKFTIFVDKKLWVEEPIIAVQSTLTDSEVFMGVKNYTEIKKWPKDCYSGKDYNLNKIIKLKAHSKKSLKGLMVINDEAEHIVGVQWPKECETWTEEDLTDLIERMMKKIGIKNALTTTNLADLRSGNQDNFKIEKN